jgi:hypothetical protein
MADGRALGAKVRAVRRHANLSQPQLAAKLGISTSYLNLIEHDRRPLSAALLIRLADTLDVDIKTFSADHDVRLVSDLLEVFGDPVIGADLTANEVREIAATSPAVSRAILTLYTAYRAAQHSLGSLAGRLSDASEATAVDHLRLPTEEVSDMVQARMNYFPDLEEGARRIWKDARLESESIFEGLARYLETQCHVRVRLETAASMHAAVRHYDADRRELVLSEVLRRGSRNFQIAYQVGLLTQGDVLDRIAHDPLLTTDDSRALCRVALANYFAAAVLMPYEPFLQAARLERYDVELLGHRFRVNLEQTCHRLTTLRRPGAEGVPFHMVRVDIAGNISKRFSASGLRFARYSGACPRWVVFGAFLTPGEVRTQLSQMPDGTQYFWMARTIRKVRGGYHAPRTEFAIGLGCEVEHARHLVYADGIDFHSAATVVPVGVSCRVCERMDCEQRAFPPLLQPLRVDENVRGLSFYAPVRTD